MRLQNGTDCVYGTIVARNEEFFVILRSVGICAKMGHSTAVL